MTDTDQQITPADATIVSTGTGPRAPKSGSCLSRSATT